MREFIRWLISQIANSDDPELSSQTARQRLQLVLIQDRLDFPADKMNAMKKEMREVAARYLTVADEFSEFEIKKLDDLVMLVSNIQVNDTSQLAPAN
jgi:cell division topological specificity factor MinE